MLYSTIIYSLSLINRILKVINKYYTGIRNFIIFLKPMAINLVAFDLDGTLLNDDRKVSDTDLATLYSLGENGIVRVVATGRNLYSVNKVLDDAFPADYIVFSSGAGIINWDTKEIIEDLSLQKYDIKNVVSCFTELDLSFTIHSSVPNSHHMMLHLQSSDSNDLTNYVNFYKEFSSNFNLDKIPSKACQLVALINQERSLFEVVSDKLPQLKVILTTSPVDKKSLWLEVFNKKVSKANGIQKIAQRHNIHVKSIFCIGNDYNDLDMLNFAQHSFVVDNAPSELKACFNGSKSNNHSGFSYAVHRVLDLD